MNWLDIVLIAVIAWFTITAFFAGVIREAVTLVAAVLGVLLAGLYYQELASDVEVIVDNVTGARIIAFVAIFGSLFLGGQLVAFLLKQVVSVFMLGWLDHAAGAAFGLVKGFLLVELFLILFTTYPYFDLDRGIGGSAIAPFFLEKIPALLRLLPAEFQNAVDDYHT